MLALLRCRYVSIRTRRFMSAATPSGGKKDDASGGKTTRLLETTIFCSGVDRAKTDVYNITGVVVEQVSMEGVLHYRVGAKPGVLKGVYARHQSTEATL